MCKLALPINRWELLHILLSSARQLVVDWIFAQCHPSSFPLLIVEVEVSHNFLATPGTHDALLAICCAYAFLVALRFYVKASNVKTPLTFAHVRDVNTSLFWFAICSRWSIDHDLVAFRQGWLPQALIDQTLSGVLMSSTQKLLKYINHLRADGQL